MFLQMKNKSFLVTFTIITVMFVYGCGSTDLSKELIGVWKTLEPKYEDCFFEFKKDHIVFGDIEGDINVYLITKIISKVVKSEERILYDISYKDQQGLEFKFLIYYDLVNDGEIRFKNQDQIVWKKMD